MKEPKRTSEGVSVADLKKILPYVRKNWWIVFVFAGLFLTIGEIYVYKLEKVYSASTQLLLKSNDEFSQGSLITENTRFYGSTYKTFIDNSNEIRVLKSQDLIERALSRLDFDVSYFLVGRLRTTEVYSGVPFSVKIVSLNKDLYEELIKFKILSDTEYELNYTIAEEKYSVKGQFNAELMDPHMEIMVTKKKGMAFTKNFLLNQANYLIQPHQMEGLTRSFLSRLTVENPEYTNVLKISLEDVLPERATRFLDTLSAVYIENSLTARLEINKNTLYYISRQMDEVSDILNDIEDTLQEFREDNSVIDLDKQSAEYFRKFSDMEDAKRTLLLKEAVLDDLRKYVIEDKDPAFLPPSVYVLENDEFEQSTLKGLYDKQQLLNSELNVATPNNFSIRNLRNQIDSTKSNLLIYIKNTKVALQRKEQDIDEQIAYYNAQLHTLPVKQRGLLNIMRKQKVNEDMYLFLLQRRANTIIARASIVPETKIIEKPRFSGQVRPNESKITYTFLSIGIILALVLILVRVLLFHRIESYEELKGVTTLPILGDVVFSKVIQDLTIAVEHDPKSAMAESFRTIRTNLQYMSAGAKSHVFVLTSNNPGEGKTFCSLNLAATIAKSGRRTILLELDLHKPRVQQGLDMKSDIGISTVCIGKNSIDEVIFPTKIENLYALLSGPIPPNPSELITSTRMEEIIAYCKENFEYVIIDTPPVGLITDALVLMKQADVLLFVMNTKFAYRRSIESAKEIAAINDNMHFGFILNGVKRKKSKYYYNRYGYGYSNYGYGSYGSYSSGYGSYGGGYGSYGEKSSKPRKPKK